MILDIRTLVVISLLLSVMLGLALFLTWRVNRGMPALWQWSGAYLLLALGFFTSLLRSRLPSAVELVACNGFLGASLAATWMGIRSFLGISPPWRVLAPVYGTMLAGVVVFGAFDPDARARVTIASLYGVVLCVLSAVDLLRAARWSPCTVIGAAGGIFSAHAAFYALRAVMTLFAGGQPQLIEPTALNTWVFLEVPMVEMALGIAFLVMTTERLQADLRQLATYDGLTRVFNRRAFLDMAARTLARQRRGGVPFSLLLLDIDHFKRINDTFGHQAGDQMLRAFADFAQGTLRQGDLFGRYGGEEFCALLPETGRHGAQAVAERLRAGFSELVVEYEGNLIATTVSIGVTESSPAAESVEAIVAEADMALYRAKAGGRDRVEVYEAGPAPGAPETTAAVQASQPVDR